LTFVVVIVIVVVIVAVAQYDMKCRALTHEALSSTFVVVIAIAVVVAVVRHNINALRACPEDLVIAIEQRGSLSFYRHRILLIVVCHYDDS
jgi:succinate dehydrogenase hydrophobic anchor subunit